MCLILFLYILSDTLFSDMQGIISDKNAYINHLHNNNKLIIKKELY